MSEQTSESAKAIEAEADSAQDAPHSQPRSLVGPSTNVATNLLIADIVLQGLSRILRKSLRKKAVTPQASADGAPGDVKRSVAKTLAIYGASRIATRSRGGTLLVGSGLLAKTLYDRGVSRRNAKRSKIEQASKTTEEK